MTLLPDYLVQHSMMLALAVFAVGLPAFDAVRMTRVSSWLVCLIVFCCVSYGLYGIEELFFRDVWPSLLPFIVFGGGLSFSIANTLVLRIVDRKAREQEAEPVAGANAGKRPACG